MLHHLMIILIMVIIQAPILRHIFPELKGALQLKTLRETNNMIENRTFYKVKFYKLKFHSMTIMFK